MKLAIVDREKCKPTLCGSECKKYCPALATGVADGSCFSWMAHVSHGWLKNKFLDGSRLCRGKD